MVVCHCLRVSEKRIEASIRRGAGAVDEITADCVAGSGCGRCRVLLEAMLTCAESHRAAA